MVTVRHAEATCQTAAIVVPTHCEGLHRLRHALCRIVRVIRPSAVCSPTFSRYGRVTGLGLQLASREGPSHGRAAARAAAIFISGRGGARLAIASLAASQSRLRAVRGRGCRQPFCHRLGLGSANTAVSVSGLITPKRSGRPMSVYEMRKGRSAVLLADALLVGGAV